MKLQGMEAEWFEHDGAKFQLKPLKWPDVLHLGTLLTSGNLKESFEFACGKALVGWDGVEDDNGPIQFTEEAIELLPITAIVTIAKKVIEDNCMGAEDEKN